MTAYQMEVNNAGRYIMENNPNEEGSMPVDIFQFSLVLAIVHCKAKEEVLEDIIKAQKETLQNA
jgi:hypothetical protein